MTRKTTVAEQLEKYTTPIPETSCVIWFGCENQKGYGRILVGRKRQNVHRVVYEMANGPIPDGMVIDHVCHERSCVNPAHMRVCTNSENAKNRKLNVNNKHGFKGVYKNSYTSKKGLPPRWVASIQSDGKAIHLGSFATKEEAHKAYCKAAVIYHGEFANFGGEA